MIRVNRQVVRELGISDHRGRRLVLKLCEGGFNLAMKTKGSRGWLVLPLAAVWRLAGQLEADRIRAERKAARKAKLAAKA
jgi:hypothetical protein